MIRKLASIDVARELVQRVFSDVEEWAEWMPGVQSIRVLERSEARVVVVIDQVQMGRKFTQEMEYRFHAEGMKERQLSGWFKKWEAEWRFLRAPQGDGVTLSLQIDLELGLLGLFTPSSMLHGAIDRMFEEMVESAETRARGLVSTGDSGSETRNEPTAPLLQVFQTPEGLEVRLGGRKYFISAED